MEEEKKTILNASRELFLSKGFRSVTLDEIAKEVKVSKKTIYKFFSDKDELVATTVEMYIDVVQSNIQACFDETDNAIDAMLSIANCLTRMKQAVNPSVIFELEKYYAAAYKLIQNHKEQFIKKLIVKNLENGISQGYYRKNINAKFIAALYIASTNALVENGIALEADYTINPLNHFFEYHLRGIASTKGIAYINNIKLS